MLWPAAVDACAKREGTARAWRGAVPGLAMGASLSLGGPPGRHFARLALRLRLLPAACRRVWAQQGQPPIIISRQMSTGLDWRKPSAALPTAKADATPRRAATAGHDGLRWAARRGAARSAGWQHRPIHARSRAERAVVPLSVPARTDPGGHWDTILRPYACAAFDGLT